MGSGDTGVGSGDPGVDRAVGDGVTVGKKGVFGGIAVLVGVGASVGTSVTVGDGVVTGVGVSVAQAVMTNNAISQHAAILNTSFFIGVPPQVVYRSFRPLSTGCVAVPLQIRPYHVKHVLRIVPIIRVAPIQRKVSQAVDDRRPLVPQLV